MRVPVVRLLALLLAGLVSFTVLAQSGPESEHPFDTRGFKPLIVFHEFQLVTDNEYVTISGVVFSRAPLDRLTIGERSARIRPAEPKDLVRIKRAPAGAKDAPYRTYFEVPDAKLPRLGVNDLAVRAISADERRSDLHRVTVVRVQPAAAAPEAAGASQDQ